jgi:(hydroxyamino)benzene mutase
MDTHDHENAGRRLLQLGMVLFLLGLITGLVVPAAANPRMALASHLEGLLNGIFLLVLGLIWPKLYLSAAMLKLTFWLAIYSSFSNWAATLLAAFWSAGSAMMPLAGQGHTGTPSQELVLKILLVTLSLGMIVQCALLVFGLRRPKQLWPRQTSRPR